MPTFLGDILNFNLEGDLKYETSYTCRYNTKKDKLFLYAIKLPDNIVIELKKNIIKGLDKVVEIYDPEQESSDNIYKFDSALLIQNRPIIRKMFPSSTSEAEEELFFSIENEDTIPVTDKIDFIIHKISFIQNHQKEDLLVFSKHKKNSVLNKIYRFFNNEDFEKVEKTGLYVFNEQIACIYYNDFQYIYNMKEFHEIFKYWEKLKEIRGKVLNFMEEENLVSNLSDYRQTFEQHYNIKSMIKIDPSEAKEFINKNKDAIYTVCEQNEIYLSFDKNNSQFTIKADDGVTTLNRILSHRSGHNLMQEFITFPTFKKHNKKVLSGIN